MVTAEIFLLFRNVIRTNVVRANDTVTVGFCSRCSQNIWSRMGQEQLKQDKSVRLGETLDFKIRIYDLGLGGDYPFY